MRSEHLSTLEAFDGFLHAFEHCALAKAEWTHAAHVAAAASYLFETPYKQVLPHIRKRICAFNVSVGGQNTETSGYHETLTRFWLLTVAAFLRETQPVSRLEAVHLAVEAFGEQRTLHTLYYSGDVVRDSSARLGWRAPDLQPLTQPED